MDKIDALNVSVGDRVLFQMQAPIPQREAIALLIVEVEVLAISPRGFIQYEHPNSAGNIRKYWLDPAHVVDVL